MDTNISNLYDELLKVPSINEWKYTDSFSEQQFHQFQQFASGKHSSKNFNYILCKMLNNKGTWCAAS